ncbi:MAG: hypothetical protein ACFFAJ_18030 [Candidatus Hodarchaeota archaeon]
MGRENHELEASVVVVDPSVAVVDPKSITEDFRKEDLSQKNLKFT